jgi:zinc transport system ATP-binding protein
MTAPLITIRDLNVQLGGNSILHGLNADLARGQITAAVGLNGSGKTTLLRAILKEVPYRGKIAFHCGHNHDRPAPEYIGYVPQKLRIDARLPLTVRDLLAMTLQRLPIFLGIHRRTNRIMEQMMKDVWLDPGVLDRPVEKISGGELQRVLLALAIQPNPELLLLDEPAAGVDFGKQEQFYDLISRLNRERGATILLVSHDTSVVSHHAHNVLCLRDGKVLCQGPPQETMTKEMLAQIFGTEKAVFAHHHHE